MIEQVLFSYRDALKERNRIEAKLDVLRNDLTIKSPTISDMPKGKRDGDKMAEYMAKVDELQRELKKAYEKTLDEYQHIDALISLVEDAKLREVLTYRYIKGYKWEDIADALSYASSYIYKLRKQGLKAVERALDDVK